MSEAQRDFWQIGKVTGAQGVRGEVFVHLFAGEAHWLPLLKEAQFAGDSWQGGAEHTLKVRTKRVHRKQGRAGLILALEGLTDRDQAEALLKGKFLYVPDEFLRAPEGEEPYLREFLDLKLLNPAGDLIGVVRGFSSNGPQDLLEVHSGSGEVHLIPLIKSWIVSRDADKGELVMDLPEGLLDIQE